MTLYEIFSNIAILDKQATIYAAEPWTEKSKAMVLTEPESGEVPPEAKSQGLNYFLDVTVAKDFLEDWATSLEDQPSQKHQRSILGDISRSTQMKRLV